MTSAPEIETMTDQREFASSSNGDKWSIGTDATNVQFILHRGNAPSGGHETCSSVEAFLDQQPFGPEREALIALLAKEDGGDAEISDDGRTPSLRLAEEYLRLGGRRRAKVDDNIVSTRKWDGEPAMASAFWKENIEPLDDKQRREVELHLPSISDN